MPKRCKNARLWPDMRARVEGDSECTPPFTEVLRRSSYAFFVVSVPNIAFVTWFEEVWRERPDGAVCEMVLALNPAYGTHDLGTILERLFVLQSEEGSQLKVKLLTPGRLEDAEPRLSIVMLQPRGEPLSVSVGSSHSLGLGIHHAGDVNLWAPLDQAQANAMRQLAKAYWVTAADLTKARCEVPLLQPCKGDDEGYIHWQAYEAQLNDANTPIGEEGPTIGDLPLSEDGSLDEDAVAESQDDPPALDARVPKIPSVVSDIQELYQKGSLVSVSQRVKPLAVPIPPSLFGQNREDQVGAIKHTQNFNIQLFASDAESKKIEKARKGITEIVKLFSFTFGVGKYWVPDCAREALGKAIALLDKDSGESLNKSLGGNLDAFLNSRRAAIKKDCENIYKKFYPEGTMPESVIEEVLDKLKERAEVAIQKGFTPKITPTSISFRYSEDTKEDPWTDAHLLLADIVRRPRDMIVDPFASRRLKPAGITLNDYLVAMDVTGDGLVQMSRNKGEDSAWVKDRARQELDKLKEIIRREEDGSSKCLAMLEILNAT